MVEINEAHEAIEALNRYRMPPGLTRKTLFALRKALYTDDYYGVMEVLQELNNEERWFIVGRLEPYERTMIGKVEQMDL